MIHEIGQPRQETGALVMRRGSVDSGLSLEVLLYGREGILVKWGQVSLRPLPENTVTGDRTMAPSSHILSCDQLIFIYCLVSNDLEVWGKSIIVPASQVLLHSELALSQVMMILGCIFCSLSRGESRWHLAWD